MSGDDTVGVVKRNNRWYVGVFFADNYDSVVRSKQSKIFDNYKDALVYAHELDQREYTEYGVVVYEM